MRLILKFFIFPLLLTSPLSVNSAEPEVLFLWQISSGHEWESYGDENVQQKYEGITSNGEPDGKGILSFPDGKRVTGEWKNGNEWNTDHFNNEGKLIGRTAKGKYIIGAGKKIKMVLFLRKVSGRWGWHEEGVAGKDYKYEGTIENGKPNGSGIYNTPSGNQYIGDFKDGKKHGRGIFTYTSGSTYKGEFKDGKKHGQGTFTSPNGNLYVGQWEKSKKNGQGTFTYASGSMYQGEFKDDKQHGQGTFTWKNGAKRVGEFRKGKLFNITEFGKNGKMLKKWVHGVMVVDKKKEKLLFLHNENGKWIWLESGNEKYDGKYVGSINKKGIPGGAGTLTFPDGNKYEGEWKDGERNGRGTYTYNDGNQYIGDYKSGKKHGQGLFTFPNGNKYEGEWKEEKRHGQGSYTWANGEKYVGEFKDGKFNGQGSFTFPEGGELEGHKYEGEWKDDKKNGQGTYFFPDGGKLVGEFRKDSPWNITDYDKNGKIKGKYVNGVRQ